MRPEVVSFESSNPALLLIDIQQGFQDVPYWGQQRNNPLAEVRARGLLTFWRIYQLPVFHIQHCSTNANSPLHPKHKGNGFQEVVKPITGEYIIQKEVNSAFIGTNLKYQLDQLHIKTLVVAGLTTDHCVSTTVRMAANLGYETYLVSDATATFNRKSTDGQNLSAELIHETALSSLRGEFATITDSEAILKKISQFQLV